MLFLFYLFLKTNDDDDDDDDGDDVDGFNDDDDVKSCPGVKSRAMDRCFCWVSTARGSNQVF